MARRPARRSRGPIGGDRLGSGGSAPRSLPNAYGSLAEAEYRLGVWDDAQAHVDVAVSLAHDSDQVWELPLVHAVAAFLHAGRGDTALADQHVAAAASAAELAPLPLSVYHAAMARAPPRPKPGGHSRPARSRRASGVAAGAGQVRAGPLTEREQTVAGLVAAGKSNREVGTELYLSAKATEYHLGNIFTKVGVRSRHQLASRLARGQ